MKISLFGGLALAVTMALAAAGFAVLDAKHDLAMAKTQVQTLTGTVALKQEQIDVLAQTVTTASELVTQIKNERALVVSCTRNKWQASSLLLISLRKTTLMLTS